MAAIHRGRWLAGLGLLALIVGLGLRVDWSAGRPALDCRAEDVRWGPDNVARCGGEGGVPAGPALTLGVKLDLNRASETELALVPGVGPVLAASLVKARVTGGGFRGWEDVDRVPGIGPAKLAALRASAEIR